MKIAYGTYAMPDMPLEESIPLLRSIGYDGVEIYIGDKHKNALPADCDSTRRSNVRKILEAQQLGVPALMLVRPKAWEPDADLHARKSGDNPGDCAAGAGLRIPRTHRHFHWHWREDGSLGQGQKWNRRPTPGLRRVGEKERIVIAGGGSLRRGRGPVGAGAGGHSKSG